MLAKEATQVSVPPTTLRHIIVLSFPFASHPALLLSIIRSISSASAHTIKFSFFSTQKANKALFLTQPEPDPDFPNITPYNVDNGLPEGFQPSPGPSLEEVLLFLKAAQEKFTAAMEVAEEAVGCKASCLISDAFYWFAEEMAAEKGVPWVAVYCSGPLALVAHVETDLIHDTVGITTTSGCEDKFLDFIPGFSNVRCADLPIEVVLGPSDSPFSFMLYKMGLKLPKANAVVIKFFEEGDPVATQYLHSKLRNLLYIGLPSLTSPPLFKDEFGCIEWLEKHEPRSVVYLSLGTVITPPPPELEALAEALKETGHPFIWSFRGDAEQHFCRDFLERSTGKIVKWAPQEEILGHRSVGVFVTQFGWNSVMESITKGVPMIGRPFFGDHPINRRAVESIWRIGIGMEGGKFTKDEVVRALRVILVENEGKYMRERVDVLKEAALQSVGPNGGCTRDFKYLVDIVNK